MGKNTKDIIDYLRRKQSRNKDINHQFKVKDLSEMSVESIKREVRVDDHNYINGWKAECKFQDLDMDYNKVKIIYVLEDDNGKLYSFSKNNSSSSSSFSADYMGR